MVNSLESAAAAAAAALGRGTEIPKDLAKLWVKPLLRRNILRQK